MSKHPSLYESLPPSLGWLAWYGAFGVDEAMSEEAICHFVEPAIVPTKLNAPIAKLLDANAAKPKITEPKPPAATATTLRGLSEAKTLAAASQTIAELFAAIDEFDLCPLHKTADKTVVGDGITPETGKVTLMVVGGAPDDDEDRQGLAYSGYEGKMLDQILDTIDLSRQTNCYVAKSIFWRPPGLRAVNPQEIALCRPFIMRLIELVRPKYLLLLDSLAAEMVTGKAAEIAALRGQWLAAPFLDIPTLVTFSPKLIANSAVKKQLVWKDLLRLQAKIMTDS